MAVNPLDPPWNFTNDPEEYDRWFRARVQEALAEPGPGIPHEVVQAYFARRRAETLREIAKGEGRL